MANKLLELIPIFLAISGLVTAALVILAAQGFARFVSTRLAARRERKEAQQVRTVAPSPLQGGGGLFARLSPFATRFKPQSEQALVGLRLKLAQAGLSAPGSVEKYAVVQLLSFAAAGAMIIPWILAGDAGVLLIGIAACGTVGMLLPRFWLAMRTGNRRERISSSLASTLDLLVTCMDAGLGLEQAVDRVALELRLSEAEMAEELQLTLHEMRAGIPVSEAFRKLSQRVGLEEMKMLCSVIIQSATLGASIGAMLRQYAASWRTQRMMDLEEKAGKMTAALTLPLTLCLLPSAILAMLGPAVIVVVQNLG